MAALGDERLMELLETDGEAIASGDSMAFESGAIAELVERCAWSKVQVVLADEREKASAGDGARIDVGTFKERFGVTRKFAIPLLEYLDRERVTRRVGDVRVVL